MSSELFIGLMSGTSMDAVDCALVDFTEGTAQVVDFHNLPLPLPLKSRILALCNGEPGLRELGETDVELGRLFAQGVRELLERQHISPAQIAAIGSHGQTVWHQPPGSAASNTPFTLQIADPNTICELTGITTVADFRRKDMAAGGQGAPLVPAFHREVFYKAGTDRVILNLGGIANITLLGGDQTAPAPAFDTGPANVLMDLWINEQRGDPFDEEGAWAATGTVNKALLAAFLREEYFHQPPPKSTGRELFNARWLQSKLAAVPGPHSAQDVQATLLALTSTTVADAITQLLTQGELIVCGGGARNRQLTTDLAARLPGFKLTSSGELGIEADSVEAVAFAWLARKALARQPIDCREITGARHANVMGGIYYPA